MMQCSSTAAPTKFLWLYFLMSTTITFPYLYSMAPNNFLTEHTKQNITFSLTTCTKKCPSLLMTPNISLQNGFPLSRYDTSLDVCSSTITTSFLFLSSLKHNKLYSCLSKLLWLWPYLKSIFSLVDIKCSFSSIPYVKSTGQAISISRSHS